MQTPGLTQGRRWRRSGGQKRIPFSAQLCSMLFTDGRAQPCLTAGSRQHRSEWVRRSRSSLRAGGGLTPQQAFSPGSWCDQPDKPGKLCAERSSCGPSSRRLLPPMPFLPLPALWPTQVCDKKGESREKGAVAQRRGPSAPCVACRPQPEQPCEGQVKPPKIRMISFICSTIPVPLRGTPKQFGVFVVECFFPFYDRSNVSSLSLEVLLVLLLCWG